MSTNLNIVDIVPNSLSPGGEQILVTATTAASLQGQLIFTAPGDKDSWAEVSIEVVNISNVNDYCLVLQWAGIEPNAHIYLLVGKLQGIYSVVQNRLLRGGMNVYATCLAAAGTGAGSAAALNVYVRPSLVHRQTNEAT